MPLFPGNLTHGASEGEDGAAEPSAYLGGLKEYCMCPQELRSERQCAQRGGRERQRKEKDAKCKNRLETAESSRVKQTTPHDKRTQTAGHTRLDPLKTRGHTGKWRSISKFRDSSSMILFNLHTTLTSSIIIFILFEWTQKLRVTL